LFGKMGSQVFTKKKYAVCLYCLQIKIKRTPTATNCYEIRSCSIHGERDWKGPLTPVIKGSAPFPSMGNVIRKHHCPVLFFSEGILFLCSLIGNVHRKILTKSGCIIKYNNT
jgi:hypothetical protein